MSSNSKNNELTEDEKKLLPTFDEYCIKVLEKRETYHALRSNVLFFALFSELNRLVCNIQDLTKDSQFFLSDDDEFKERQQLFDGLYGHVMILQSMILKYYGIRDPNWEELKPIKYWLGVMISAEDFNRYILREGSPFYKMKPQTMEDGITEMQLREESVKRLREAFEKDPDGARKMIEEETERMRERIEKRMEEKKA